jgi:hypothetical protein
MSPLQIACLTARKKRCDKPKRNRTTRINIEAASSIRALFLSWRGHFFKLEDKLSGRRNSSANKISFRPSNNRVEGDKLKFNAADQYATARTLWAFVDGIPGFTLAATMSTERVEACGVDAFLLPA